MATINLLYKRAYAINDNISVVIPTVGEILEDEDSYYSMVSMLTAMPIDLMVELDDAGIDFTTINDYELFIMLFGGLKQQDTSLIFGDLDLSKFEPFIEKKTQKVFLRNKKGVVIDRLIHDQIATTLRTLHHLEKNNRTPANKEAKEFMLKRAREKRRRHRNRKQMSELESMIIAMVNTPEFKYDFEGVKKMSIYQFNESVRQVVRKINYDNRMIGVYAGTIDAKKLSQDDLTWIS